MPANSKDFKSALSVNKGISQPPVVNQESVINYKSKRRKKLSVEEYVEGILSQNRTILSQAITLIESSLPKHYEIAQQIIEKCLSHTGHSIRIGITGVPGVGKSTFIEALGNILTTQGHKLAVLAIDPSSERSGGSILGDKTRMEQLSTHPDAFIRPSPTAGSLGGVARKTRETIYLCEAAGFDVIFIETVGVGQSETAVHSMVDFFLLLMLSGAGDELQGIKRGIMEMADAIAITKSDGTNIEKTYRAKAEYQNALHLFPIPQSGWIPKVVTCSAQLNQGIDTIWNLISEYINHTRKNNYFHTRRIDQAKYWMHQTIRENLGESFYKNQFVKPKLSSIEKDVLAGKISSFEAARTLLSFYFAKIKE
jgi:LAO/AO transport system kinase